MHLAEIITMRSGEELDKQKLAVFLRDALNIPTDDLIIRQFSAGASNLTYLLQVNGQEYVLRRPPLGPLAPKAHDMEREYNILKALEGQMASIPHVFVFTKDESILGSPFFIMERKKGVTIEFEFPKSVDYTPQLGRKLSEMMIDTLVDLHAIDYEKTAIVNLVKPTGFLERQVHSWIKRYKRVENEQIEGIDELVAWLVSNLPSEQQSTIIHYDFKFNNMMFSEDFSQLVGLFDWEMTTVGDPLADVGVALSYWVRPTDSEEIQNLFGKQSLTLLDGFYSRQQMIARYAEKSGRDLTNINYYMAFAYFKLAVIALQIYDRYKKGQTEDQRFAYYGKLGGVAIRAAIKQMA
nr:phosphotransferase family protein [Kurthia sibirica]